MLFPLVKAAKNGKINLLNQMYQMDFILKNNHIKQFGIFLIGGGLGALINLALTYLLTEFFGVWYMGAYSLGVCANIIFNFWYHKNITFKIQDKLRRRMVKFALTNVFIGGGIMVLVYMLTEILKVQYILSGIIAIGLMSIINFLINKFWVFLRYERN